MFHGVSHCSKIPNVQNEISIYHPMENHGHHDHDHDSLCSNQFAPILNLGSLDWIIWFWNSTSR